MPLEYIENIAGVRCGVWRISESAAELARMLDDAEITGRIAQEVSSEKRRKERLAATLVLRELAGLPLFVEHDGGGRPYIDGSDSFISVSHSREYAAVGMAQFPVGIDIEKVSDKQASVADKFVMPCENEYLPDMYEERRKAIALLWSVKEAVYKLASDWNIHLGCDILAERFTPYSCGRISVRVNTSDGEKNVISEYRFFADTVFVVSQYRNFKGWSIDSVSDTSHT